MRFVIQAIVDGAPVEDVPRFGIDDKCFSRAVQVERFGDELCFVNEDGIVDGEGVGFLAYAFAIVLQVGIEH